MQRQEIEFLLYLVQRYRQERRVEADMSVRALEWELEDELQLIVNPA